MALFRPAPRRRSSLIALATVAAALAAVPKAQAASYYWLGGNYDYWSQYAWNEGYTGGGIGQGVFFVDDLYFGYVGAQDANNNVFNDYQRDFSISTLNFANQSWYLNGYGTLLFRNGAINVAASSPEVLVYQSLAIPYNYLGAAGTLSLNVASTSTLGLSSISGNGSLYKNGGGTATLYTSHTYDLGTNVNGGRLIDYHPSGNYRNDAELEFATLSNRTFGGTVFGGGNFTKSGSGTLNMNGSTSWTGDTFVNEGRLILRTPQSSRSYNVKANAALEFDLGDASYGGSILGAGSFTKSGGGTLTLSGNNSYSGGTWVNAGRLIDKNPHGDYQNNSGLVFDVTGNHQVGRMSGAGEFIKRGSGIVTLGGPNTFIGNTYVQEGTLRDYSPHGGFNISPGAQLQFSGDLTFNNVISGAGQFTKFDAGTVSLTNVNTYTGGTLVDGGTLIDHNPHGNYRNGSQLDFRIAGNVDFWNPATGVPNTITGQGHFTKSGAGSLVLFGSLGYFGTTTINEGVIVSLAHDALPTSTALTVNANGALTTNYRNQTVGSLAGSGRLNLLGGNFTVNGSANTTFSGLITEGASFTKDGSGTLTLTGANSYRGGTAVNGGRLADQNPHGNYAVRAGATLEFQTSGSKSYSGSVTGEGKLVKGGDGTLTLSGTSIAHTGGTIAESGRLIDLDPHGNYQTNAVLEFAKSGDYAHNTAIAGMGSFTKSGMGALTLGAANTYRGTTTVSGGTLRLGTGGSFSNSSALTIDSGATFDLNGRTQTFSWLLGGGSLTLGNGALTVLGGGDFSGVISGTGSLTKRGPDWLTLSGSNTYTGGTKTFGSGRLIDLNPHGDYAMSGSSELEFRTAANTSATLSGAVSGTGYLFKTGAGTLTLEGANSYTSETTVEAGRLIDLNPHGDYLTTAALEFRTAGTTAFSGLVHGSGSLTKSGAGTLKLADAPTNTGGVRVSGGTLSVDGGGTLNGGLSVDADANFRNASGGVLTVEGQILNQGDVTTFGGSTTVFTGVVSGAGNFSSLGTVDFQGGYNPGASPASVRFEGDLKLSSSLQMELGGTALGTGYDHLSVDGAAFLGGALDVVYYGGFAASAGQSFDLFDFAQGTGTFASISLPTLSNGLVWNTSALYTDGTIRVQSVPEPASLVALGLGGLALLRRRKRA